MFNFQDIHNYVREFLDRISNVINTVNCMLSFVFHFCNAPAMNISTERLDKQSSNVFQDKNSIFFISKS